jgi:trehalose/maltose transport system substrate-binding protein
MAAALSRALAGILGLFAASAGAQAPPPTAGRAVTVTLVDGELGAAKETIAVPDSVLEEFTRRTAIQVRRVRGPEGALNQLAMWRESLRKGTGAADVYTVDVISSGMLAEYLVDLRPQMSPEIAAQDPNVVATFSVEGRVVAIPYRMQLGVLLYRRDLLRRYAYGEPPKTWDELEAMAARIQEGERARGERDFWGFVWQGAPTEGLTCNALEWQASQGGGRIIEDDKTVSVNNPQAVQAWQRAARWVGSISPPGVVAYREWDSANAWSAGKAAFFRTWESVPYLADWVDSGKTGVRGMPVADTVGVTRLPGGRSGRAGTLGGTGFAVSRASAHPRESLELLRFLSRRRVEMSGAPGRNPGPAQPDVQDLPTLMAPPRAAGLLPASNGVVARPSIMAGPKYEEVSRAFIRAVHSVLTGEASPAGAASSLEKDLVAITGFEKGAPRR